MQDSSQNRGISVIIPVLREEQRIATTLRQFQNLKTCCPTELIVVDGDPGGSTVRAVNSAGLDTELAMDDYRVKTLCCPPGRAHQMNIGARQARGDILLFLHADCDLPAGALSRICECMQTSDAGAFDISIDESGAGYDLTAWMANRRSRLTRIPYGDQAIFLRHDYFKKLGAYRELPLMEDLDLMRRIKRDGGRLEILNDPVTISSRRWKREGLFYGTLRNWSLAALFYMGVSPERLARFYRYL